MIDHYRVSRRALTLSPADTLGKLRADVGEEELGSPKVLAKASLYKDDQCYSFWEKTSRRMPSRLNRGEAGRRYQTHNIIVLDPVRLTPRTHNPRVVKGDHSDDIYALGLDSLQVFDVAGEVTYGATGGERPCERGGALANVHVYHDCGSWGSPRSFKCIGATTAAAGGLLQYQRGCSVAGYICGVKLIVWAESNGFDKPGTEKSTTFLSAHSLLAS